MWIARLSAVRVKTDRNVNPICRINSMDNTGQRLICLTKPTSAIATWPNEYSPAPGSVFRGIHKLELLYVA
jgi:hypothetical protein